MNKKFQRRIEDFTCGHCGAEITGNGYTNHCPRCLWSRHVDINPGDRAAECKGLMEPVRVLIQGDKYTLFHRCVSCGEVRKNKTSPDDDFEMLLEIAGSG